MNHLLRGSTPPLIVGGTPAGIACAAALVARGLSPTLVANGLPLGGRGRIGKVGPTRKSYFPDVYEDERSLERNPVASALASAHSGGCVIQKDDRVVELKIAKQAVSEISVVGMLGEVRRRPRLVILADSLTGALSFPDGEPGDRERPAPIEVPYIHFLSTRAFIKP